jgi:hypothetical protein
MTLKVEIHVPPVPAAIEAVAEGLTGLNFWIMTEMEKRGTPLPRLYDSGIRYRRESAGREWWESISDALQVHGGGEGDCEDLSAIRAAELRFLYGEPARVRIGKTSRGSFHAVVQRGDGSIEDPSRIINDRELYGDDPDYDYEDDTPQHY